MTTSIVQSGSSKTGDLILISFDTASPLAHATAWPVVVDAYLQSAIDSNHARRACRRHWYDAVLAMGVMTVAEANGATLAAYRAHITGAGLSPAHKDRRWPPCVRF